MRSVPGILLGLALTTALGQAHADEAGLDDRRPHWRVATSLVGGEMSMGGRDTPHGSLEFEVARARGSFQWLAAAQLGWMDGSPRDPMAGLPRLDGARLHARIGGRWIARTTRIDSSAAFQLYFDAAIGVETMAWRQLAPSGRPDLAFGWGLQVRGPLGPVQAFRIGLRLIAAPPIDEPAPAMQCADCVAPERRPIETGFASAIGVVW